jgi:hypothetical protein
MPHELGEDCGIGLNTGQRIVDVELADRAVERGEVLEQTRLQRPLVVAGVGLTVVDN